jgi:preprotein translocase subunit SecG
MVFVDYVLLAVSVFLIAIIVLQSSKDDVSKAFSGEKSELFANKKERGFDLVISRMTAVLSVLFFVLSLVASLLVERGF